MNRGGGDVRLVHVPEIRIRGNTHIEQSPDADLMSKFLNEMAFYLHLGPFSRRMIEQMQHRIADLEGESQSRPGSADQISNLVTSRHVAR